MTSALGKLVLMDDHGFLVADETGDVGLADPADGLYHNDTRYLSRLVLTLDGQPLVFLSAPPSDSAAALVMLANPPFAVDGTNVLPQTIGVRRTRFLHRGLHERIELTSFNRAPIDVQLQLAVAADFRDMFDIRGFATAEPGELLPAELADGAVCLRYRGRDGVDRETRIVADPPFHVRERRRAQHASQTSDVTLPDAGHAAAPTAHGEEHAHLVLDARLEPNTPFVVSLHVLPREAGEPPLAPDFEAGRKRGEARRRDWLGHETTRFACSEPALCRLLERSAADLYLLTRWAETGPLPVAGIPWFACPFGRDSLIAAYEALPLAPELAAGTLRFLARHQGTKDDPWRDEEPGKIMHELRTGELARLGEVPFTPYFGSVDSTPLFLMLLAEADRWLGDDGLVDELWPAAERALAWVERRELLTYKTRSPRGIRNQGWKDSDDSVTHADGRLAEPPIALIEPQGYAYAARRGMARLARQRGDAVLADRLERDAERIRRLVRERFWRPELGCYAEALDRDGCPVLAVTSNAAHALWTGLASDEEAAAIAERFARPDMLSGWGLRTLSSGAISFNPMSYHNGSVWPHDNAIATTGFAAYGHYELAQALFEQLYGAAQGFRSLRLPELYCGFQRLDQAVKVPAAYPVSCSPQAWAAGAPLQMLRALLGLEVDARAGRVTLRPRPPAWLDWMRLENLRVGRARIGLEVRGQDVRLLPGSDDVSLVVGAPAAA